MNPSALSSAADVRLSLLNRDNDNNINNGFGSHQQGGDNGNGNGNQNSSNLTSIMVNAGMDGGGGFGNMGGIPTQVMSGQPLSFSNQNQGKKAVHVKVRLCLHVVFVFVL